MSTHIKTVIAVLGVVVGVILGELSLFGTEVTFLGIILTVCNLFLIGVSKRKAKDLPFTFSITFLFLGIMLGVLRVQFVKEEQVFICQSSCTFTSTIISSPEVRNNLQTFVVKSEDQNTKDVLIKTLLYPHHTIGESVILSGVVSSPKSSYPHNGVRNFDYSSYLSARHIGSEMYYPNIKVEDKDTHFSKYTLGAWKESLEDLLKKFIREPASSLALGMLFGTSSLSDEVKGWFKVSGLSHIIVLSGFNIAIVIAFALFIFRPLPLFLRVSLTVTFVIGFVIAVGGEASIVRATLMSLVALLALLLGRSYVAKQALVISFLCIILYDPFLLLHDISLHLSFLATAGIVYLGDFFIKKLETSFSFFMWNYFSEVLGTSIAAYFATLPYLMYTFGSVALYALLANIVVLPFVSVTMLLSFLTILCSFVSHVLATICGVIASLFLDGIIFVAKMISLLPYASLSFSLTLCEMFFCYLFLFLLMLFLVTRKSETCVTKQGEILTDIIYY